MIKSLKILLPLALLTAVGFFAYPIIKNRYFQSEEKSSVINISNEAVPESPMDPGLGPNAGNDQSIPFNLDEGPNAGGDLTPDKNLENYSGLLNLNERGTKDSENLAHITTEHCNTNCDAFAIDFELLEYCQQVCGIAPVKEVSDCDGKSGIEKDYCLKDLAIGKKDSKLCDPIKDANVKLTCQNRILEDLVESQQRSEEPNF